MVDNPCLVILIEIGNKKALLTSRSGFEDTNPRTLEFTSLINGLTVNMLGNEPGLNKGNVLNRL